MGPGEAERAEWFVQVVRFFDRKEFYTVVGENALFVARCASSLPLSNLRSKRHRRRTPASMLQPMMQGCTREHRICRQTHTCRG